jgi:F0F1-type ATP synthase assembly protein I
MADKNVKEEKKGDSKQAAALFIPAGLFLGFGIGFLIDNVPAGMFIGFGVGFTLFALVLVFKK